MTLYIEQTLSGVILCCRFCSFVVGQLGCLWKLYKHGNGRLCWDHCDSMLKLACMKHSHGPLHTGPAHQCMFWCPCECLLEKSVYFVLRWPWVMTRRYNPSTNCISKDGTSELWCKRSAWSAWDTHGLETDPWKLALFTSSIHKDGLPRSCPHLCPLPPAPPFPSPVTLSQPPGEVLSLLNALH